MDNPIPQGDTAQTELSHLWSEDLPDGRPLLLARLEPARVSRFKLLDGAEERLVRGCDASSELGTDALCESRGAETADELSGVLLTPGSVEGLVLERGALWRGRGEGEGEEGERENEVW